MAPRRESFIDWKNSEAKYVLLDDLERGILPLSAQEVSAEEAWVVYQDHPSFEGVQFDQFKARLADHRKSTRIQLNYAQRDNAAITRDLQLYPRQSQNHRGEAVFDVAPAKLLLRDDIDNDVHKRMTFQQLWQSRSEYQAFAFSVFCRRIYQEIRRKKFVFLLETKRQEAIDARRAANEKRVEKLRAKGKKAATNPGPRPAKQTSNKRQKL